MEKALSTHKISVSRVLSLPSLLAVGGLILLAFAVAEGVGSLRFISQSKTAEARVVGNMYEERCSGPVIWGRTIGRNSCVGEYRPVARYSLDNGVQAEAKGIETMSSPLMVGTALTLRYSPPGQDFRINSFWHLFGEAAAASGAGLLSLAASAAIKSRKRAAAPASPGKTGRLLRLTERGRFMLLLVVLAGIAATAANASSGSPPPPASPFRYFYDTYDAEGLLQESATPFPDAPYGISMRIPLGFTAAQHMTSSSHEPGGSCLIISRGGDEAGCGPSQKSPRIAPGDYLIRVVPLDEQSAKGHAPNTGESLPIGQTYGYLGDVMGDVNDSRLQFQNAYAVYQGRAYQFTFLANTTSSIDYGFISQRKVFRQLLGDIRFL